MRGTISRPPLLASAFVVIGLVVGSAQALGLIAAPHDAALYWNTALDHPYGTVWGQRDAVYVYPPPLLVALEAIRWVGWPVFTVLWTTALFWALWYAGRLVAILVVLAGMVHVAAPGVVPHPLSTPMAMVMMGNVAPLLAAAVVAGFRSPAAWSLPLLTKIAPGVGVLWFVVRREWRSAGVAAGATGMIVLVTLIVAPAQWMEFVRFALDNATTRSPIALVPIPSYALIPLAAGITVWAGLTGRRWPVAIACGISSFALYEWTFVPIWLAAPTLWWQEHGRSSVAVREVLVRVLDRILAISHPRRVPDHG